MQLPVLAVVAQIKEKLRSNNNLVLVASPGAGKTTQVPLALMDEEWLCGRKVLMLQPRRLATRMVAGYMARLLGDEVGETVGYRVRLDSKVGPKTRIELITEGILIRMIQSDPSLADIGLVIFDEFHERSLFADLGLALCQEIQAVFRQDLRIVVMSATLAAESVANVLGNAPVIQAEGRSFPVEVHYQSRRREGPVEELVADSITKIIPKSDGDLLAFLPGAGEIRRVKALLEKVVDPSIKIAPLYGTMAPDAQEVAVSKSSSGERKIVLATAIAETSLTVEGVTVVVDAGLMRLPRFSSQNGMTRLETVRVSRASADQRRGRAGRLGPGACYCLWAAEEDKYLEPFNPPEILSADLTALALELAVWGVKNPADLRWLDQPPEQTFYHARSLLVQLGAIDKDGLITSLGRQMAESGIHPRLSHMIIRAKKIGLGGLACELAALLDEKDVFNQSNEMGRADLRLRIETLRRSFENSRIEGKNAANSVNRTVLQRLKKEINHLRRIFAVATDEQTDIDRCGLVLAYAYPDRIAKRRLNGRFLLRAGRGAEFGGREQALSSSPYLVVAALDEKLPDSRIFLAAPLLETDLWQQFADQIATEVMIVWDREQQSVKARKVHTLGSIVLKETPLPQTEPERVLPVVLAVIAAEGLDLLPWTRAAKQLRHRMEFMHTIDASWPDVSDEALSNSLKDWLGPFMHGMSSRNDFQRLDMFAIMEALLTWDKRRILDEWAPAHIVVPSGSKIAVDYEDAAAPVLAVRLQELFGLKETPRVAGGRVALTLKLLSPANRPIQVTKDLASFWRSGYFEVKKDLMGRYPKHYWPDSPLDAIPTNRAKPR